MHGLGGVPRFLLHVITCQCPGDSKFQSWTSGGPQWISGVLWVSTLFSLGGQLGSTPASANTQRRSLHADHAEF